MIVIVVGSVSTVAIDPNGVATTKNRKLTHMSNYMKEQDIAKPLRDHARRSMANVFEKQTPFREAHLLDMLPAALRKETILESNADIIEHIPLFRRQNDSTKAYLLQHMRPYYTGPNERIYDHTVGADGVYFIIEGFVKRLYDTPMRLKKMHYAGRMTKEDGEEQDEGDKENESNKEVSGFNTSNRENSSRESMQHRPYTIVEINRRRSQLINEDIDESLLLPVCILGPGNFFGHECLVDADEPTDTFMKTSSPCKFHVLLASNVAQMIEAHPALMKRAQLAILAAHKEQAASYDSQMQRLEGQLNEMCQKVSGSIEGMDLERYIASIKIPDNELMREFHGDGPCLSGIAGMRSKTNEARVTPL